MYEVGKIKKAVFNGRQVKMFDVWKMVDGSRVFFGCFQAPVRTANKNLLAFIADKLD